MLSKETVQAGLQTGVVGRKLFTFESIDSTNNCARTLAETGIDEGAVVVAEFQSDGRGRHGRTWTADPSDNLLFSVILRPRLRREETGFLTFFAAVSVARAIERTAACSVECKWPNDLLLNGRKICGILLENSLERDALAYAVVGIGINVNQRKFHPELKSATSLLTELGRRVPREPLLQEVLRQMDLLYADLQRGNAGHILEEWNRRCTMFGRAVTVEHHDERISGTAVSLERDGGLRIQTESGFTTVYAGDVTIVSP